MSSLQFRFLWHGFLFFLPLVGLQQTILHNRCKVSSYPHPSSPPQAQGVGKEAREYIREEEKMNTKLWEIADSLAMVEDMGIQMEREAGGRT